MNAGTLVDLAIAKALGADRAEEAIHIGKSLVLAFINEGYHKVERAALWKFCEAETSINLAAAATTAPKPVDMAVPLMARNEETSQELLFHDERQMFLPSSNRNGQVETYSIFADTLRFNPAPAAATVISLRYYKTWSDLVADEDEPQYPATWHDILSSYAASLIILRLKPSAGRYLPESEARPWIEAWQSGLAKMMESPLTLPTSDNVESHHLTQSIYLGEGVDW